MTCMRLNDVNRGLPLLIISFVDYPIFTKSWILCYILTSFIISTQGVALFNLLFISIRRLINAKNVRRVQKGISSRKLTTVNISMWVAHFAMCLLLFIIWARRDSVYLKTCCMLGNAFGDILHAAAGTIMFTSFLIPLFAINTLAILHVSG